MDSQRHSRSWMLVASIVLAGGLAAGKARADIYVHVMNCADMSTVKVNAYDAKDGVRTTPASSGEISTGNNEQFHCAGEGKGYCQMQFKFTGNPDWCYSNSPDWLGKHVDSGKWAVITGFYNQTEETCDPAVEVLDSQPTSCEAVCGKCREITGDD